MQTTSQANIFAAASVVLRRLSWSKRDLRSLSPVWGGWLGHGDVVFFFFFFFFVVFFFASVVLRMFPGLCVICAASVLCGVDGWEIVV